MVCGARARELSSHRGDTPCPRRSTARTWYREDQFATASGQAAADSVRPWTRSRVGAAGFPHSCSASVVTSATVVPGAFEIVVGAQPSGFVMFDEVAQHRFRALVHRICTESGNGLAQIFAATYLFQHCGSSGTGSQSMASKFSSGYDSGPSTMRRRSRGPEPCGSWSSYSALRRWATIPSMSCCRRSGRTKWPPCSS